MKAVRFICAVVCVACFAALGASRVCAQAEVDPDHFDTPNAVPFSYVVANAAAVGMHSNGRREQKRVAEVVGHSAAITPASHPKEIAANSAFRTLQESDPDGSRQPKGRLSCSYRVEDTTVRRGPKEYRRSIPQTLTLVDDCGTKARRPGRTPQQHPLTVGRQNSWEDSCRIHP
jgi:hypothetical protein